MNNLKLTESKAKESLKSFFERLIIALKEYKKYEIDNYPQNIADMRRKLKILESDNELIIKLKTDISKTATVGEIKKLFSEAENNFENEATAIEVDLKHIMSKLGDLNDFAHFLTHHASEFGKEYVDRLRHSLMGRLARLEKKIQSSPLY